MVAREVNARKSDKPGRPTPNKGEAFEDFYARCLTEFQFTPLELVVPRNMGKEHERLSSRFRELQRGFRWPFEGPNLTAPREAIFQELYFQIVRAARRSIKQQAERALERNLAYLIDRYYPDFFTANGGRAIPARMTIFGGIALRLNLRPAPQKPPTKEHPTDFSEVEKTISEMAAMLAQLTKLAGKAEEGKHLLAEQMTKEDKELWRDIRHDTASRSMGGVAGGLRRLETSLDQDNTCEVSKPPDPTVGLTVEELKMRARAMRTVGVPPCLDFH